MPRNLKLYITAVVTLSAIALVVATRLFPPESRIALTFAVGNIPGVTVAAARAVATPDPRRDCLLDPVTLLASAFPVELPRGSRHAVALAPIVAAMSLGGPAVAVGSRR